MTRRDDAGPVDELSDLEDVEADERSRPTGALEEEGIPDHEGPLPSKEATGDGQDGIVPPGDAPWAADRDDVTAQGQREGSTLDERLALEEPDTPALADDERPPALADEDRPDREPTLVANAIGTVDAGSAEERAMRVVDEPPGGADHDDDGYVHDEGGTEL